jgi:hypothetical protein
VRDSDDDATAATIAAEHGSHRAAHCEVSFELKGELRAGAEAAELLRAIAREFTQPPRGKGGAA